VIFPLSTKAEEKNKGKQRMTMAFQNKGKDDDAALQMGKRGRG